MHRSTTPPRLAVIFRPTPLRSSNRSGARRARRGSTLDLPDSVGMRSQDQQLTILHIVEATSAGVGRHVRDLVDGLSELGVAQGVAYSRDRADSSFLSAIDRWEQEGIPVQAVPMSRAVNPARDIRSIRRLLDFIATAGPFGILHGHSSKGGALARIAAKLAGARAVYTPHGLAFTGTQFSKPRRALYWFFEFALRPMTDGFVAVAEGEATTAERSRLVPRNRLFIVHNGIAPLSDAALSAVRDGRLELRERLGIEDGQVAMLSAGRLSAQKAPDIAVAAASIVVEQRPEAVFYWAGDGELRSEIENEVRVRGLEKNFHLLGQREDLGRLMPAFDALFMPSRYEGLPYAMLEAMSAGLPIIGTRVSGIGDLLDESGAGFVIENLTADEAVTAVLRLLDLDPDNRTEIGLLGRKQVAEHYTARRMVSETFEAYRSVLRAAT